MREQHARVILTLPLTMVKYRDDHPECVTSGNLQLHWEAAVSVICPHGSKNFTTSLLPSFQFRCGFVLTTCENATGDQIAPLPYAHISTLPAGKQLFAFIQCNDLRDPPNSEHSRTEIQA